VALDVVRQRLQTQRLIGPAFAGVAEAVAWFGAMQAQDYRGALWAIGQRVAGVTEADVEQALARREVVRTWPMRGTLHFVAADDARWLTRLLAPRVIRRAASRYRELGLDGAVFAKSRAILEAALAGGHALTRGELYATLACAGVSPDGQRGIHIVGQLAMQGVLCTGAPRGKQQTFVLLDDWIPRSRELTGDAALAELARRYVASHGPVTALDLAWWSGLNATETARALELAGVAIERSGEHWLSTTRPRASRAGLGVHLLPPYDEYAVAYRDRDAFLAPADRVRAKGGIFAPVVLVDGRIAGTWRRTTRTASVTIEPALWTRPRPDVRRLLELAARRYGEFVGNSAALELTE